MSELQSYHCMTPEQWTWLLWTQCGVWVLYWKINGHCKN